MHELLEWINPEKIIHEGGIYLLAFVIFAETGLFVGFFLPGDSLLFVAGLCCSPDPQTGEVYINTHFVVVIIVLIICAILGNLTGYAFGKWMGKSLYQRKDGILFKKKYLTMTENYYARHGTKTIFIGRFLPIIRTFAPILAGVIRMNFNRFFMYTLVGAVAWITTFVTIGYSLGQVEGVRDNLKWIVIGLIAITLVPVALTYFKERKLAKERKNNG
ncbi:MAG TPA: VTT domain-containing protein [Flavobacteriales bacterium]|nr:VTT domain-containing protein [Flavobacteriales bacterium]